MAANFRNRLFPLKGIWVISRADVFFFIIMISTSLSVISFGVAWPLLHRIILIVLQLVCSKIC